MAAAAALDPRAEALLAHRRATRVRGDGREWLGDDPEADRLLRGDGLAMLIGLVLQRGMPAERVWRIPLHLHRELGHLDPARLAAVPEAEVEAALRRLPARPRYPGQSAATIVALARLVLDRFDGDGRRVWEGRRMNDVIATLQSLPGVGPGIAHMAVQELMDEVGYEPHANELPGLDVKADVHVVRVFHRLGIADDETRDAALAAARRHHPAFPGLLDWPAWDVGRRFCRPQTPECGACPLDATCEKRGLGGPARAPNRVMPGAVTLPLPVLSPLPSTTGMRPEDGAFWSLLAQLLMVALNASNPGGVPRQFAPVGPLLESNPEQALATCRRTVTRLLRERLGGTGNEAGETDLARLVDLARERGVLPPDRARGLSIALAERATPVQVADAVAAVIGAMRALDGGDVNAGR